MKYIVLAGADGSGKSYIADVLKKKRVSVIAEPFRFTEATKLLADIALRDKTLNPLDRFNAFLSNRILGWSDIKQEGSIVSDRSYVCSITYTIADIILKQTNEPFSDDVVYELTDKLLNVTKIHQETIPLHIDKLYLLEMSSSLMYERFKSLKGDDLMEQDINYLFLVQKIYKLVVDMLYNKGYIHSYEIVTLKDYEDAVAKSEYVSKTILKETI